jgi:hypothetical protein
MNQRFITACSLAWPLLFAGPSSAGPPGCGGSSYRTGVSISFGTGGVGFGVHQSWRVGRGAYIGSSYRVQSCEPRRYYDRCDDDRWYSHHSVGRYSHRPEVVYVPAPVCEQPRVVERREVVNVHDDRHRGPTDKERVQRHLKDGWQALEDENYLRARREFQAAVDIKPKAGMPNLGLALAHAALGDDDDAEHSMRVAFKAELPEDLKLDKKHKDLLEDLADHYQRQARGSRDADEWFMLAAVQHLRERDHAAHGALFNAVDFGGQDRSTTCLAARLAPDAKDRDRTG